MPIVCAGSNTWMVSVKLTVCVGLVERQAVVGSSFIFGTNRHMFLVWDKALLRRMG